MAEKCIWFSIYEYNCLIIYKYNEKVLYVISIVYINRYRHFSKNEISILSFINIHKKSIVFNYLLTFSKLISIIIFISVSKLLLSVYIVTTFVLL